MHRTQIQLTDDQYRQLKRWAGRLDISLSEAVRRCVADRLGREPVNEERTRQVSEALGVVGKYADPTRSSRVAKQHDEHLARAFRA